MGIDAIKSRLSNIKDRVVGRAKLNVREYKRRRAEAREFQQKEKAEMQKGEQMERLKIARNSGREKARQTNVGFGLPRMEGFLRNPENKIELGTNNRIDIGSTRPISFGNGGLTRDVVFGDTKKKESHKVKPKRKPHSEGKTITIKYG